MKYFSITLLALLITTSTFAQKLPKIKGSKNVVVSTRKFDSVKALTVYGKIKLNLIQSDTCKLVINADGNLHETVMSTLDKGTLSLELTHRIVRKKHFELNFYIDTLQTITLMERSKVKAVGTFKIDTLRIELNDNSQLIDIDASNQNTIINTYDNSKLTITLNTDSLVLKTQDNSQSKLTIKSNSATITTLDNGKTILVGTIKGNSFKALDNSQIISKDCICDTLQVIAKDNSKISTLSKAKLSIDASGKSEIQCYGNGKISIVSFKDNAVIRKKE